MAPPRAAVLALSFSIFISLAGLNRASQPLHRHEPKDQQFYFEDDGGGCEGAAFVSYRLHFKTTWSEELFPKSYPKWRPPAQWSVVFAQSHGPDYRMFAVGEPSTTQFSHFVERGTLHQITSLMARPEVFDQFTMPRIRQGSGEVQEDFFVDGNHSRISFAAKLIPSPDWFVGVDGLDLCSRPTGEWLDDVTLSMGPLDAGTLGGYTFTAPRWRIQPAEDVSRITSKNPSHRAASFYYPEKEELPSLATVRFTKVKEYSFDETITEATEDLYFSDVESTTDSISSSTDYENVSTTEKYEPVSSEPPLELSNESVKILETMTYYYKRSESYFPKIFRPNITNEREYTGQATKDLTSGNLSKTRLPSRPQQAPKVSSLFDW